MARAPRRRRARRTRVLRSALERAEALDEEVVGEMNLGRDRVSVPRFSPDNPPLDATGRIDAMALYAGEGVGAVRRRERAAAIVADLAARLPRGDVQGGA
jgi:nitronate monooxygenase